MVVALAFALLATIGLALSIAYGVKRLSTDDCVSVTTTQTKEDGAVTRNTVRRCT